LEKVEEFKEKETSNVMFENRLSYF